jgi:hypothetical protein
MRRKGRIEEEEVQQKKNSHEERYVSERAFVCVCTCVGFVCGVDVSEAHMRAGM